MSTESANTHGDGAQNTPGSDAKIEEFLAYLRDAPRDRNRIIAIPLWGWTGDGKTCAILTPVHYCRPQLHGLGLALPIDTQELERVEASSESYRGLDLASLARLTNDRVNRLLEQFIDQSSWPPGTDDPDTYLLRIRTLTSTLGYALLSDVPGGSFREADSVARRVLDDAHGCVVMVDPGRFDENTAAGRLYTDEIDARIQHCVEAKIPTAVLVTKSDLHPGSDSPADKAHRHLTMVVAAHKSPDLAVFRVSVVGSVDSAAPTENQLPPAQQRAPEELLRAWVWLLTRILSRPADAARQRVPTLHLQAVAAQRTAEIVGRSIPELRSIGEFSDPPGRLLCAVRDELNLSRFLFLEPSGTLAEVGVPFATEGDPQTRSVGQLQDPPEAFESSAAYLLDGALLIGERSAPTTLWRGGYGDTLLPSSLPMSVESWSPIDASLIAAIDATGRLHLLAYEQGSWAQRDYLADVIGGTEHLFCHVVRPNRLVIVANGLTGVAVEVSADGRLGDLRQTPLKMTYDTTNVRGSAAGCIAALNADATLVTRSAAHEVRQPSGRTSVRFALAPTRPLVAFADEEDRLRAFLIGEPPVLTDESTAADLAHYPDDLEWSASSKALIAVFGDDAWHAYLLRGL